MDHSSGWVSGSSQGLSCAIEAEPFSWNQEGCVILTQSRCCADMSIYCFTYLFHVLSNLISASLAVIKADCFEAAICNTKLMISLYYMAEMKAITTKHASRGDQIQRQKSLALGIPV